MASLKVLASLLLVIVAVSKTISADDDDSKKKMRNTITEEVWFDVVVEGMNDEEDYHGRFVIALFGDIAPMSVMNFQSIVRGYKRGKKNLHYKNSPIHRIVPDFIIQMGDVTNGDGTGGASIYGDRFVDENFEISHKAAGYVSMANHGQDTNGSQFFILLTKARWLDGKHVVFGKVIKGMDVVQHLGNVPASSVNAIPKRKVFIEDCGVVGIEKKYDLTDSQMISDEDI
ncbi:peptidyl-prolyl cis-trans isomerase A2-like [Mizuhopecten yessoensis]|uniref:Peptidyl-prolyl cis-trans isomerase n=1 Tax=Mizuhopecten yessoensis TaxID=6573 RepID=A0A210QDT0_MIZYE|nr:peptidyl-prolyl cis-trans isomerase A2-like [Mizuhopecten yessoensis]OWF46913.1 Peptidyl-prolyl cis-trans isomerase B [Mizuhopecten yessoensis]